ncbi:phosphoglycerate kinase [Candidatus Berkelbacteria bacterium]|nr:phosphoglycerate kinase [Candidatus Berkelbacteria bacterium]
MQNLKEFNFKGKKVVIRTDYDVPLNQDGEIVDDYRIKASLPTIEYLQSQGVKEIYLVAHLGRPVLRPREKFSNIQAGNVRLGLGAVALRLKELLNIDSESLNTKEIKPLGIPAYIITRGVYLLENIRFDWRETDNNGELGRQLAQLGDYYIYDAFAVAHRTHASTAAAIKEARVALPGLQLLSEIDHLDQLKTEIKHPFVCVLGGAKAKSKIPVMQELIDSVDTFLLGGVIANTFLKAEGVDVKRSTVELAEVKESADLIKQAPQKFVLPEDYTWQSGKIMDIGQKARQNFKQKIHDAKTIFWNGTVGVTSLNAQDFKFGSEEVARAIATNQQALKIISGGDTVGFVNEIGLNLHQFSFVSTGGGATLKYLAGEKLPAMEELKRK